MTPSWYDVLDVDPDASTEQIRAAWKSAIGDLDPGHRRFRALNDAAEVLLDPQRRAAHDEQLAREAAEAAPRSEPADGTADYLAVPPARIDTGRALPLPLLGLLLVLAGALAAGNLWLRGIPTDAELAASTRAAQASAERAAVAVLAFDYRDLDASEATAVSFLTEDYRRTDYEPLFAVLRENAPATETVVTVEVVASGIVRSGQDRVSVLVFVNRPTQRADLAQPEVYRDQVTMEMVDVDGEWLVDEMDTNEVTP